MEATIEKYTVMLNELAKLFDPTADISPLRMDSGLNDVYELTIATKSGKATLAITEEAMISAYNTHQYKNGQFKDMLGQIVAELSSASKPKHSYIISIRGLRTEPAQTDLENLAVLAGLEEAAKIGDEFAAKMKRGAA